MQRMTLVRTANSSPLLFLVAKLPGGEMTGYPYDNANDNDYDDD